MESNYRNKDFEELVKQNADQYRMFPSEKVWKNIHGTLHTRRKWYGAGLAFLLLLTGTAVTWVMVSYPVSKNQTTAAIPNNNNNNKEVAGTTKRAFSATKPIVANDFVNTPALPFNNITQTSSQSSINVSDLVADINSDINSIESELIIQQQQDKSANLLATEQTVVLRNDKLPSISVKNTSSRIINNSPAITSAVFSPSNFFVESLVDAKPADQPVVTKQKDEQKQYEYYPLTIESVLNSYQPKHSKQIIWQLFVTPTVSYRKLDENKSFENTSALTYPFASLSDVNKAVTHKPDMGLQLGLSAAYPVTSNLRIRGGFQFNVNRYDIKASPYNPEIATINLNASNGVNSVSTLTPYRNYGGFKSDWLKNFYFSISVPVGIELKLLGGSKTSFGIAGTLQPTYIIKDRAYLISTDYKNYAEVPSLIRHVNLNTGFETFVNYTSGKTHWQIGPQVRYQVLSSFHNKYPVKENLFDFGVKVAVSLNE